MVTLARDNHYIPRSDPKGWWVDGQTVWRYWLLVSRSDVAKWERVPIPSIGCVRDLYTSVAQGAESDAMERHLNETVEAPAAEPLRKVRADQRLTSDEWERLYHYVVALDGRTVASYTEDTANQSAVAQCQNRANRVPFLPRRRTVALPFRRPYRQVRELPIG